MFSRKRQVHFAQREAPRFRRVTWYRDRGLIQLYLCCAVTCLASATTGYDGSMLNVSMLRINVDTTSDLTWIGSSNPSIMAKILRPSSGQSTRLVRKHLLSGLPLWITICAIHRGSFRSKANHLVWMHGTLRRSRCSSRSTGLQDVHRLAILRWLRLYPGSAIVTTTVD